MWEEATREAANMLAMRPYPGLQGRWVRHAVPQPGAESGTAATPADVGRVLAARDDPPRRAQWARRADLASVIPRRTLVLDRHPGNRAAILRSEIRRHGSHVYSDRRYSVRAFDGRGARLPRSI